MKSVAGRVLLFLVTLQLVVLVSIAPWQSSQATPPPLGSQTTQPHLLAQAQPSPIDVALDSGKLDAAVPIIEQTWEKQYEDYFRASFPDRDVTAEEVTQTLSRLSSQTGQKAALVYVVPRQQQLELVVLMPDRPVIRRRISQANNRILRATAQEFQQAIANPRLRNTSRYLPAAQQLYEWMVAPIEAELAAQKIDTLLFCLGVGLRTLPLAALHDGEQFLIEKYNLARIPAFKLTDTLYAGITDASVLAMGASQFRDLDPLPSVPVELVLITKATQPGRFFLNQEFTLPNLQLQRQRQPSQIVHLATHADFQPGAPHNSYIQLWNDRLELDQLEQLNWNSPPVELLVLSACRTAIGDESAELGFAGLAVQAGVKSAVASLWYVSDTGTLALMTEFYRYLRTAPIKAEALRQAQIALLRGQVRLEKGQLHNSQGRFNLPPELAELGDESLSSPYYWAAFTVVGSPW